ncbi:Riboflavin kinase (fragment) [groundwater metagenome]|uniref:Riboflavin kinase n=1 Tax=groundwater metagenome TaxID=717931 RepID=A0A098E8E3_9ZZZZ
MKIFTMNEPYAMKFKGTVTSGLREGAYYIEIYKEKIKKSLHITPFPGTLNLKCNKSSEGEKEIFNELKNLKFKEIDGFDGLKGVRFIKCAIKKNKMTGAWIVIPEIRKHNFVELISDVCLREKLNLKDGDEVEIYV